MQCPPLAPMGEGGDLSEADVMCKKSKHVEHPVGDQFVPIHLPENIPPVENNDVSEFSGEMEFSGGPTDFFEVSVGGNKAHQGPQEISEGQSAVLRDLSLGQNISESQVGTRDIKKSQEVQKKSEIRDFMGSSGQSSKRKKIETLFTSLTTKKSKSPGFFEEKLENFSPNKSIPQCASDFQCKEDLRGMGSPLHNAPLDRSEGWAFVSPNPPEIEVFQVSSLDSMDPPPKFSSENFAAIASGFQLKTTHSGGLTTPKSKLGTESMGWTPPRGGTTPSDPMDIDLPSPSDQIYPQTDYSSGFLPRPAANLSPHILGIQPGFGENFGSVARRTPPHVEILGKAPAGIDIFEPGCLPQSSQACQSSSKTFSVDPLSSFEEMEFSSNFSSRRAPALHSLGGWVGDRPSSQIEHANHQSVSVSVSVTHPELPNMGVAGITPINKLLARDAFACKCALQTITPLCPSFASHSMMPVPCKSPTLPQAFTGSPLFRPIFSPREQNFARENLGIYGDQQKVGKSSELLWLIDGEVEQGLEFPLTPPRLSPKIRDAPADFEDFCRGSSLTSVFGELVIDGNETIFPKGSFEFIGPGGPPSPKIVEKNPIFEDWVMDLSTPTTVFEDLDFSCDTPVFGASNDMSSRNFPGHRAGGRESPTVGLIPPPRPGGACGRCLGLVFSRKILGCNFPFAKWFSKGFFSRN